MLKHDAAPSSCQREGILPPSPPDSLKSCYNNFSRLPPTVVSDETNFYLKRKKAQIQQCGWKYDGKEKQENHFPFFNIWNSLLIPLFNNIYVTNAVNLKKT